MNPKHIIVSINPHEKEADKVIDYVVNSYPVQKEDKITLVSGVSFDIDVELAMEAYIEDKLIKEKEKDIEKIKIVLKEYGTKLKQLQCRDVITEILEGYEDPKILISKYVDSVKPDLLIIGTRELSAWKK